METHKRGIFRFISLILVLVVLCSGVSYLTVTIVNSRRSAQNQPAGHQWLHDKLQLTAGEIERIDVFEGDYHSKRAELQSQFQAHIEKLAQTLRASDSYSPEVTAIVHELHAVHGQIQQLAIEHYYDMLSVLPPAKKEKLRQLAVEALSQPQ